jgi:zinc transporter ZupT
MKSGFFELLLLGIFAASANILGGLILFPSEIYRKLKPFLNHILALSAGFMISVIFVEILPRIEILGKQMEESIFSPMVLLLAGYMATQFFEHTIAPHFHLGEELTGEHLISTRTAYTAIAGLTVHTFFDGVSISATSALDYKAGLLVFIAVFMHKIPEGFTIASIVLAAGRNYREVLIATGAIGLTTLLGVVLFMLLGARNASFISLGLPFAGGIALYVAASDLIPEVNHHGGKNPLVSLSVFAGVAMFFILHNSLHLILD